MKTLSMTATLIFMELLTITAATATAHSDEKVTQEKVVSEGLALEGAGSFLLPLGIYSDLLQPGFGFQGSASYPIFFGTGTRTKLRVSAGYLNHGIKDDYYDVSASLSLVPVMFGTQQSWGDKIRFEIGSSFGPVFAYAEACDDYICVESDTETYLGVMADMGVKFKVNAGLTFGLSAGFMMYDFSAEIVPMSFTLNISAGYEL